MANSTVRATSSGLSAKPFSRSADTGTSVAETRARACSSASSRVTDPSSRPSVAANPLLVVASAANPSEASNLAEPWSQALGMRSGRGPWCNARNRAAICCCVAVTPRI